MCITTETNETETSLINGISKLEYITLENTITSEDNGYSETMFLADGTNSINADITLSNCYVGTLGNGKTLSDDFLTTPPIRVQYLPITIGLTDGH